MSYYAKFETIGTDLFRFDTRIYLGAGNPNEISACVGAVIGINPGSARPRVSNAHHELDLNGDKMLPYVRNRFLAAYSQAGREAPSGAYVQVLNVFYLCDADLGHALRRLEETGCSPICDAEKLTFPVAWYAWGAENIQLARLKERFSARQDQCSFFMNRDRSTFGNGVPHPMEFAKHPRCMPASPVEKMIASAILQAV